LSFAPADEPDGETVLVWIEIKHGADPHGTQLDDYEKDIAYCAADHLRVMVLAPQPFVVKHAGRSLPEAQVPETMPLIAWDSAATSIRAWLRNRRPQGAEHWILGEYLRYLTEERLMDDEVLTAEHALALAAEPAAASVVTKICEDAAPYV